VVGAYNKCYGVRCGAGAGYSRVVLCRGGLLQLIVNVIDINDNAPMFPLSQYIVQGIAETVPRGTDIIQGTCVSVWIEIFL